MVTFWTVCPYCYYMYEYDGIFKGCSLRCQNCRRPFHGESVAAPPVGTVVEGKEQYYCGVGYFALRYDLSGCLSDKKGQSSNNGGVGGSCLGEKKEKVEDFVMISDDSDDDFGSEEKGKDCDLGLESDMGKNGNDLVQESVGSEILKKVKKRVKSVARTSKKVTGRGKKIVKVGSNGNHIVEVENGELESLSRNTSEEGLGFSEDELEFFVGEDDVYVGFRTGA